MEVTILLLAGTLKRTEFFPFTLPQHAHTPLNYYTHLRYKHTCTLSEWDGT